MSQFRVTIRHGSPHRYHVVDVTADDLRAATQRAVEHMSGDDTADLLEIRRLVDPDTREFVPGAE